ncbi:hypothetical protein KA107_02995 [Candidatus Pacearchaeota archaeon]|nr:hypothetical protein [Candidatus Pacearchaeota archaeon]
MGQYSVYQDLIAAKSLNRLKNTLAINWSLNYPDPELHFLFNESFRDRILADFYSRGGKIILHEKKLATWYFSRDYRISELLAEESLHHSTRYNEGSRQRRAQLVGANHYNQRAEKALESAKAISGEDYLFFEDYSACSTVIKEFRRRLYFAEEFFDNWEIIAQLEAEKLRAIKTENYERAGTLAKMIKINLEKAV